MHICMCMSDTGFILLQGPLAIPDAGRGPGCVEAVMSSQTPSDNEGGSPAAGLGVSPQRSASFGNSHWKQTASATATPPSGAGPLPATDQSGQAKAAVPHPPPPLGWLSSRALCGDSTSPTPQTCVLLRPSMCASQDRFLNNTFHPDLPSLLPREWTGLKGPAEAP